MAVKLDGFVINDTEYEIQDTGARAQIAALVSNHTDTDNDYASEVVDSRIGNDGKTYPSMGEAMRQQFADFEERFLAMSQENQQLQMTIQSLQQEIEELKKEPEPEEPVENTEETQE